MFVIGTCHLRRRIVDYKLISIKNGGIRAEQRCKRADCIFPRPTVRFDFEEGRIVAAWTWVGVQAVHITSGLQINIQPTLLLVRISCN
jgi:hypothetical protein